MLLNIDRLVRYLCDKYDCDNCPLFDQINEDCMCALCESVYMKMEEEEQCVKFS